MRYRCDKCGSSESEEMVDEMHEVLDVVDEKHSDVKRTYYVCKGGCLDGLDEEEVEG